jgi:3-oxoacyl-[acyl-carrier-protein] synthase-1
MDNRVVITGLGVVAPNGVGIEDFKHAIKGGISGIKHNPELEALGFSCQISGTPPLLPEHISACFSELELRNFKSTGIMYGVISGMEAWRDAGLKISENNEPDWDSGIVFGAGTSGIDKFREAIYKIDNHEVRRLGSTVVSDWEIK